MWPRRKRKEQDSKRALTDARRHLKQTEDRAPEVTAVSGALRSIRETNHFAEHLAQIMGSPR